MKIDNISIKFGEKIVYDKFSLEVESNKILAVLGKSGCGKTTLLQAICGNVNYEGIIDNKDNKIGYVFQQSRLIPMLNVEDNLKLVLSKKLCKDEALEVVNNALKIMHLEGFNKRYPATLSGGEKNRVGLARAYCYGGNLLLMDEPFKALDIGLKYDIIKDFIEARKSNNATVIMVTHDIDEAILMADRIIVLGDQPTDIVYDCKIDLDVNKREIGDSYLANVRQKVFNALIK